MCLQDIKIARRKYTKVTARLGTGQMSAAANSNRVAIAFGWSTLVGGAAASFIHTGLALGTTNVITQCAAASPLIVFTIEQFGSFVQGDFGMFVGVNVSGMIIETLLTQTDEELEKL